MRSLFHFLFPPELPIPETSYWDRKRTFATRLINPGPSPQPWGDSPCPSGVHEVRYPSAHGDLRAWVYVPPHAFQSGNRCPALVFFHCGFAFGMDDFDECRPFMDAGYVVMIPAMRGENGNPGCFEWNCGEVDDGAAAVRWLARREFVDPNRLYTFGSSFGGGISGLLSLYDDLPIRFSGDTGGFDDESIFRRRRLVLSTMEKIFAFSISRKQFPFDVQCDEECQMRLLLPNIRWMKRTHFSYVGRTDGTVEKAVQRASKLLAKMPEQEKKLFFISVPGTNVTSIPFAMKEFLKKTQEDARRP